MPTQKNGVVWPRRFSLSTPSDFEFARDCCSYGYFLLAPNHWNVRDQALTRPLALASGPVGVRITQPGGRGAKLKVETTRALTPGDRAEVQRQVTRMLRLDEDDRIIAEFHRLDPRWKKIGRGRLFRSPSMFEDVIKTVTSCNVTWPSTVQMNRRLCEVLGTGAGGSSDFRTFPDSRKVARTRVQTLRSRCRVGYRDARIVELAGLFSPARGGLSAAWFEDPATPDDAVYEALIELPGIGPYAGANIMQLLGRYARLPLDTESVRHGKSLLGFKGSSAQVMKQVHAHYAPFGRHAFRSYWFELWQFYESKHGASWTWERDSTGKMFTAALLSK